MGKSDPDRHEKRTQMGERPHGRGGQMGKSAHMGKMNPDGKKWTKSGKINPDGKK